MGICAAIGPAGVSFQRIAGEGKALPCVAALRFLVLSYGWWQRPMPTSPTGPFDFCLVR